MRRRATASCSALALFACAGPAGEAPDPVSDELASEGEAATASVWNAAWGDEGAVIEAGAEWVLSLSPRVAFRRVAEVGDPIVAYCLRADADESLCKWTAVKAARMLEKAVLFKIPRGDAVTVTVFVRSRAGVVWSASDDAKVDATPPAWDPAVRFSAKPLHRQVLLSWADGFSDENGVASYRLFRTPPGWKPPTSCFASAGLLYAGPESEYDDGFNLVNLPYFLPPYIYSLCAVDEAGGASKLISARVWPGGDATAPEITSFAVQRGAAVVDEWVSATAVGVSLEAKDDRSASENLRVSFAATLGAGKVVWSKWIPFDPERLPTLKLGRNGPWTVAARAMDEWGNVSEVKSEAFVVDTTGPAPAKSARLTVTVGTDGAVEATWPPFVEAGIGLAEYRVFVSDAGAPKCSGPEYETTSEPTWNTTLDPGRYTLLVCAADELDNVSAKGLARVLVVR